MDAYYIPLAGFLGSLSSILITCKYVGLTKRLIAMYSGRVISGAILGHYLSPLVIDYYQLIVTKQQAISCIIGLCVTQVVGLAHHAINKGDFNSRDLIDVIRNDKKIL